MKEHNKIQQFIQGLRLIIVQNPIEACLACVFFILWSSLENYGGQFIQTMLRYSHVASQNFRLVKDTILHQSFITDTILLGKRKHLFALYFHIWSDTTPLYSIFQ